MRLPLFVFAVALLAAPTLAQADPFAACQACHSLEKGKNLMGPSLAGVVGAKKASVPGYTYSAALKAKGGSWTPADLDAYLANPTAAIPGTKMPIGVADPAKRAAVIAFLKTKK